MRYHEIIGWVGDAELLCPDCAREANCDGDDGTPVFAGEASQGDYCAACLNKYIHDHPGEGPAPDWVYLDGCAPEPESEPDRDDT